MRRAFYKTPQRNSKPQVRKVSFQEEPRSDEKMKTSLHSHPYVLDESCASHPEVRDEYCVSHPHVVNEYCVSQLRVANECYSFHPRAFNEYCAAHPHVLDEYVHENVSTDTLKRWLAKKEASLPSVNQEKTNEVVNEGNELKKECVEVKNDEEDVELKEDAGYAEEVKNELVETDSKCLIGDWEVLSKLGEGSFGVIFKAKKINSGQKAALKMMHVGKGNQSILYHEATFMKMLDHPNIVKLIDVYLPIKNRVVLAMEYVDGGSLGDYVASRGKLSEQQAWPLMSQMVSAVEYLHSRSLVHRDIKLQNTLYNSQGIVKIIDFGICTIVTQDEELHMICGTPEYTAPEIFFCKRGYQGPPVDVWSLGILFTQLFAGTKFNARSVIKQKGYNRKDYEVEYNPPPAVSEELASLLTGMIRKNPLERLSMKEIVHHTWFNKPPSSSYIRQHIEAAKATKMQQPSVVEWRRQNMPQLPISSNRLLAAAVSCRQAVFSPDGQHAAPAPRGQLYTPTARRQLAALALRGQQAATAAWGQLAAPASRRILSAPAAPGQLASPASLGKLATTAPRRQLAALALRGQQAATAAWGQLAAPVSRRILAAPAARGHLASPAARGKLATTAPRRKHAALLPQEKLAAPAARGHLTSPAARGKLASPAARGQRAALAARGNLASPAARGHLASPAARGHLASPAARGHLASPAARGQPAAPAVRGHLAAPAPRGKLAAPAPRGELAATAPRGQLAAPAPWGQQSAPAVRGQHTVSVPRRRYQAAPSLQRKRAELDSGTYVMNKRDGIRAQSLHFTLFSRKLCKAFLEEVQSVRRHTDSMLPPGCIPPPVLVHCSAGVGRSGVLILTELMVACIEHNERLDVPEVLGLLREQRMFMVQTFSQYCFVDQALIHFLRSARLV